MPGWTTTSGNFTAVQYDIGGFPAASDPGPANRGSNFFAGGPNIASSSAFQFISLAPDASVIDTRQASFTLSGYFGGFGGQNDYSFLTATFLDASGSTLGSTQVGSVSSADRVGVTGLLLRSADGFVPAGARTVNLGLGMVRTDGVYNDGYADNLSLVLHQSAAPVPEASTTISLGLLLGMGTLALVARRRKAALDRPRIRPAQKPAVDSQKSLPVKNHREAYCGGGQPGQLRNEADSKDTAPATEVVTVSPRASKTRWARSRVTP